MVVLGDFEEKPGGEIVDGREEKKVWEGGVVPAGLNVDDGGLRESGLSS